MAKVVRIRDGAAPVGAVRVDRATKWGNPFRLEREEDRLVVVRRYMWWVVQQPELMESLHELVGRDLACWCAPKVCHADVLLMLAGMYERSVA